MEPENSESRKLSSDLENPPSQLKKRMISTPSAIDFDLGFKIKKKKKVRPETTSGDYQNRTFETHIESGTLKSLKVTEMNVTKVYSDIIHEQT